MVSWVCISVHQENLENTWESLFRLLKHNLYGDIKAVLEMSYFKPNLSDSIRNLIKRGSGGH